METIGYDTLLNLTDSRYRLSILAAKRAVQLKKGLPTTLAPDEYPKSRDGTSHPSVAVALQELLLGKGLVWNKTLPDNGELIRAFELDKKSDPLGYSVTTLRLPDQASGREVMSNRVF